MLLQVDLDQADINKGVNKAGQVIGRYTQSAADASPTGAALVPYGEVFTLQRFRETELIHGR